MESYSGTFSPVFTACLCRNTGIQLIPKSNAWLHTSLNGEKMNKHFPGRGGTEPSVPFVTSHLEIVYLLKAIMMNNEWTCLIFSSFCLGSKRKKPISHFDFQTTTFCTEDCCSLRHRNQFQSRQDTLCLAAPADTHRRPDSLTPDARRSRGIWPTPANIPAGVPADEWSERHSPFGPGTSCIPPEWARAGASGAVDENDD